MMSMRNRCPSIAPYCVGLIAVCLTVAGCTPAPPIDDSDSIHVPEDEFLLILSESPGSQDVLTYATELGYTSPIQSIVEYAVSPDYSLYCGVVFAPDGDAAFIIVDQRPQPFFLPAFLVTAENENIVNISSRHGGLSIDLSQGTENPVISFLASSAKQSATHQSLEPDTCAEAYVDMLKCIVAGLVNGSGMDECTAAILSCFLAELLVPVPGSMIPCLAAIAFKPCAQGVMGIVISCYDQEVAGAICDDGIGCTEEHRCDLFGICIGDPDHSYCDPLDTACDDYVCSPVVSTRKDGCVLLPWNMIVDCVSGDGCCPAGCTNAFDSDCPDTLIWFEGWQAAAPGPKGNVEFNVELFDADRPRWIAVLRQGIYGCDTADVWIDERQSLCLRASAEAPETTDIHTGEPRGPCSRASATAFVHTTAETFLGVERDTWPRLSRDTVFRGTFSADVLGGEPDLERPPEHAFAAITLSFYPGWTVSYVHENSRYEEASPRRLPYGEGLAIVVSDDFDRNVFDDLVMLYGQEFSTSYDQYREDYPLFPLFILELTIVSSARAEGPPDGGSFAECTTCVGFLAFTDW